jgi:RNase_H superfamily
VATPRVLLYDIENAPTLGWVWDLYETNVVAVEAEWYMLSFAWKWLDETRTHVLALDDFPGYERHPEDDKHLVKALHALFDEAEVTIAHNGDRFDRRKANARFLVHGMLPPSPYRTIDTLKVARRHFMFSSNKLGDLGQVLGLGGKAETGGWRTWRGCMAGDPKSWATMKKYNKQDVNLLEQIYRKLLPWIDNHPNMATLSGKPDSCPKCGAPGASLIVRGWRTLSTLSYPRLQCRKCGGYCRGRLASKDGARPDYVN